MKDIQIRPCLPGVIPNRTQARVMLWNGLSSMLHIRCVKYTTSKGSFHEHFLEPSEKQSSV